MWIYFSVKKWEKGEAGEAAVEDTKTQSETDENISIESMGNDQGKNIEYWIIWYFQLFNWKTKAYTRIFGIIYILIENRCQYL